MVGVAEWVGQGALSLLGRSSLGLPKTTDGEDVGDPFFTVLIDEGPEPASIRIEKLAFLV